MDVTARSHSSTPRLATPVHQVLPAAAPEHMRLGQLPRQPPLPRRPLATDAAALCGGGCMRKGLQLIRFWVQAQGRP